MQPTQTPLDGHPEILETPTDSLFLGKTEAIKSPFPVGSLTLREES